MSVILNVNGTDFEYPEVNDVGWGPDATNWAVAMTNGVLQKEAGLFILLNDVDFGANFGLIAKYFTSRSANAASSGVLRLANTDAIGFRNFANSSDLSLAVNGSDQLTFNGSVLGNFVSVSDTATIDLTLSAGVLSAAVQTGSLDNSFIAAFAGINLTKLAVQLAGRAIVTDGTGFLIPSVTTLTEISYVNGVTSSIQTQLNGKQASGSYLTAVTVASANGFAGSSSGGLTPALTLSTSVTGILQGDGTAISAASTTGSGNVVLATSPTLVTPALGTPSSGVATNLTGLPLTTGVTGLLSLANGGTNANLTAANGAVPYSTGSALALLAPGTSGQVLTSGGAGAPTWTSPLVNPMTTVSDIIIGGASGAATRLAVGGAGTRLRSDGTNLTYSFGTTTAKTTTYTAVLNDELIRVDASGGAWTLNLFAASGNAGKILTIKKTDSSVLVITIDANGSETIDGALTKKLSTQYESFTIECDGIGWNVIDHSYPSTWVGYTPSFTGFGSVTNSGFFSRRVGDSLQFKGVFTVGTPTNVAAFISFGYSGGNGNVVVDTSKLNGNSGQYEVCGTVGRNISGASSANALIQGNLSTTVAIGQQDGSNNGLTNVSGSVFVGAGNVVSIFAQVPISGWEG